MPPKRKREKRRGQPNKRPLNLQNLPPAAWVINRIWNSKAATPNHRDVFFAMCAHADRLTGVFYVSLDRIARMCGYACQPSVQRYVADLIRWGYLRKLGKRHHMKSNPAHHGTCVYQIVFNPDVDQDELIAKTPVKDREVDLPIEEPVQPPPPKPLLPARKYGPKSLMAVQVDRPKARPSTIGGAGASDFDVF